jgi:hypothetical protein
MCDWPWLSYTQCATTITPVPGLIRRKANRILRDICRWHVEEFAHLLAKLNSISEGDGTLLDNCCIVFVHEHAEANAHKACPA